MKKIYINGFEDSRIVIFDGVCNLCHAGVNFIIIHDASAKIKFSPAQSTFAKAVQQQLGIDALGDDTNIFYDQGRVYIKGKSSLYICKYLDPWWLKLASLMRFIPRVILDPIYNFIAHHRYQWYGKKDSYMLPSKELNQRFLID